MIRQTLLGLIILLLFGCSSATTTTATTNQAQQKKLIPTTASQPAFYNEVRWVKWDILALQQAESKRLPLAIYFYDDSCGICRFMDNTTFQDQDVITLLNKSFVPVRADGEKFYDDVEALCGDHVFPALVFLSPDGVLIAAANGYVPPRNYKNALRLIAAAHGVLPNAMASRK